MSRKKRTRAILKGDFCSIKLEGTVNLPQIVKENNEVMFIGEFVQNNTVVAICSSVYVNELLFIQKDLLVRKEVQPTMLDKFFIMQMDILTTLKEVSFQLKSFAQPVEHVDEPEVLPRKPIEEDTNYN